MSEGKMMDEHQELIENIPAYALGALDAEEAEILAAHIPTCIECQADLHAYQQTADQLGMAAPEQKPSSELKGRLFDQIDSKPGKAEMQPQRTGWREWFSQRPAIALISVGLVLVLAFSNLSLWNQIQTERPKNFSVLNLASTEAMPDAVGMIVISADGKYGTLVASDLDPLSEEQQYQLWLIKGEDRTSGGVFSASKNGYAALKVYSKQPLNSFDRFGVTIEPEGGSPGPTGEKVLGGEF